MFSLKTRVLSRKTGHPSDFIGYLGQLKAHVHQQMEGDEWLIDLTQRALLGEREAVLFSLNLIERYIREHPFSGLLPPEYRMLDVTGALFQEWIGYASAYPWFHDRAFCHSSKLQMIGRQIFYSDNGEYRPYPYPLSSLERAEQWRRALIRHDPSVKLDRQNPSAEFKMNDPLWTGRFLRVAIWIPERVWEGFTTITFRRQVLEQMTLDDQAGTGMIPYEAVSMLRALVQTYPNVIVSGPVESGKTTFANTIVAEQLAHADISTGVVMIEKHPESTLPLTVSGHRFIPIQAGDEELMEVGVQSLRHDPDIVFMTEMRWREWQFYNFAGEKGHRGLIGTYHTKAAEDIPYQGAFAVYANVGGSLRGHLVSTLQSCELVAVLEPLRHGRKKLTRLSEIRLDSNHRVVAHDWMRWLPHSDSWQYCDDLSPMLLERMQRKNLKATKRFRTELARLTERNPLPNPVTESLKSRVVLSGGG
jgi:pilus assembly protein CpaF